jgi:hypothetical protein
MTRQMTNYLLELIDSGLLDARDVVTMAVKYMSEDEVADMMRINEVSYEEDEEFGDYDDRQPDEAQEWYDFDPDC